MATHDNPHDKFFKRMLHEPQHAAGVLQAILPNKAVELIDWSTLTAHPTELIGNNKKELRNDLVFRVETHGAPLFLILLFEHQSSAHEAMTLRLLTFMVHIWTYLRDQAADERKKAKEAGETVERRKGPVQVPLVVPLVLHHGERGWHTPRRLSEHYRVPPELVEALRSHVPDFELLLYDLVHVTEDEIDALPLTDRAALTLLGFTTRFREPDPTKLTLRAEQVRRILATEGEETIRYYVEYISGEDRAEGLVETILHADATEEVVMGIRQKWEAAAEERGRAQGELKGQAKSLLTQLRMKFEDVPEEVDERLHSASAEELERWTKRILTAATIDDVW